MPDPSGRPIHYAFIDSQNLNLAIRSQGWVLDFGKFRTYLRDKYRVTKAFLFIGYVKGNEPMYLALQKQGYVVIHRPTLIGSDGKIKGNVDADLVLHTMIQFPEFDQATIVSNDGDFYCLVEYLIGQGKLLHLMIPNRKTYSSLFRRFGQYRRFMDGLQQRLGKYTTIP